MLTKQAIIDGIDSGLVLIEPFDSARCGPNSYDLTLDEGIDEVVPNDREAIDLSMPSLTIAVSMRFGGYWLEPGRAYLAHSVEVVGSDYYVPVLHGRSSVARHGLMVHYAGLGDIGWRGQYVMELVNMTGYPIKVYPGCRIAQVSFEAPTGKIEYKYKSTYQDQRGNVPGKAIK